MGIADGTKGRRMGSRRLRLSRVLPALCVVVVACWPGTPAVLAQSSPTLDVDVGFGGVFTPDRTTPVTIHVDHEGAPIEGQLVIRQTWRPLMAEPRAMEVRRSVTLGPKARLRYDVYLPLSGEPPPGEESPELRVELRAHGQALAQETVALENPRREGLVLMASESGYLQELPTGEMTLQLGADELPTDWRAYGGVRRLYLGRIDATQLAADQRMAIRKWVSSGGELVVLSGENAYRQDADWLNELVPFRFESVKSLDAFGARTALGEPQGEVSYATNDVPLLTRARVGRGEVAFSALSLLNPGPTQAEVWAHLTPAETEMAGPFSAGAELFRHMPLYYPDKMVIAGISAVYMLGIGLLMLWSLRRTPWTRGGASDMIASTSTTEETEAPESAERNRLWIGMAAWIALATAIAIGYSGQTTFTERAQALEASVMWGSTQAELAHVATGYSAIAKRRLEPRWTLPASATVVPLRQTDLTLTDGGSTVGPLEPTLSPYRVYDMALETVRPLNVRAEPGGPSTGGPYRLRVHNGSGFALTEPVVWRQGRIDAVEAARIAPGQRRTIALDEDVAAAAPWTSEAARPRGFAPRVKRAIFEAVDQRLRERGDPWALIAWVREPGLTVHSDEYRETCRMLVVTPW